MLKNLNQRLKRKVVAKIIDSKTLNGAVIPYKKSFCQLKCQNHSDRKSSTVAQVISL